MCLIHLQYQIMRQRIDADTSTRLSNHSVLATEFKPALRWLGHRVHNERKLAEDEEYQGMSLGDKDDDEIEEW